MNVLGYWNVLKGQRRVVLIGLAVTVALTFLALYRVSPSGISLRSAPVYVAESTLFVTAGEGTATTGSVSADYLGQIYAQLAHSDAVRRLIDPTLERDLDYSVQSVTGSLGTPLPIIAVSAYSGTPQSAVALANRVSASLRDYVARSEADEPERRRASLTIVARPEEASVFTGVRFTPALMLFILGITGTVVVAFTRYNIQLSRTAEPVEKGADEENQVRLAQDEEADRDSASIKLQAVEPRAAEQSRRPPARRGRWTS